MGRAVGRWLESVLSIGVGGNAILVLLAFQGVPALSQSDASARTSTVTPVVANIVANIVANRSNGDTASRSTHWAFTPPVLPKIPAVRHSAWVRTPVDAFVLAKLERAGIAPPPSTDRRTLLRRVYLDLIGLPPSLEEQQRFLADTTPNAYEKVVDDLLSRKQYGERWGRHWLDTVRYAETNGYERDTPKRSAWRYRDWVIDSLNADKPFRRFVQEQIAGDELLDSNAESQTGASFLRLGTWDDEPPDHELDRYDQLDDILGTTASAFMGVTLRCARCHDHKFEPFTQKDYYRLLAVFAPLQRPGADAVQRDPENTLLSRWRVRRLEAEAIRDSMLAVSGKINLAQGGPSIYPKLPQEVLQRQSRPGDGWGATDERQSARRSVYIFVKRSLAVPEMEALDALDTSSSCETRIVSTVAPQALTFLNGNFAREQANAFAARLVAESGDSPLAQVSRAFSLAYGRAPSPAELRTGTEFLTRQTRQIEVDTARANTAVASKRALEALCRS